MQQRKLVAEAVLTGKRNGAHETQDKITHPFRIAVAVCQEPCDELTMHQTNKDYHKAERDGSGECEVHSTRTATGTQRYAPSTSRPTARDSRS
jgi:hypothetical protein